MEEPPESFSSVSFAAVSCAISLASRGRRAGFAFWVFVLGAFGFWSSDAAAHERYAIRERLSCTACHVRNDGGDLTTLGLNYRTEQWTQVDETVQEQDALSFEGSDDTFGEEFEDDEDAEPELSEGLAFGGLDPDGDAPSAEGSSSWGDWSGQLSQFTRYYRDRVLGESADQLDFTESLRLSGRDIGGVKGLSFYGEGWLRTTEQIRGEEGYDDDDARLVAAVLEWHDPESPTQVRFGRHFVTAGAGIFRIDGLSFHTQIDDFEIDGYGGVPSDRANSGLQGDLLYGGRLGYRAGRKLRVGFSGFSLSEDHDPADIKYGLDFQWIPPGDALEDVELIGHVFYDWIANDLYDARANLRWTPSIAWQFALDYSYTVPGLFIPKNSIFSVFSDDVYEEVGLTVSHRLSERLVARGFLRETFYEDDSYVIRVGGGMDVRFGPGGEDSAGVELSYNDEERKGSGGTNADSDQLFTRAYHRLFWTAKTASNLELLANLYAGDPFGIDSTFARASVLHRISQGVEAVVGVEYGRNPDFFNQWNAFSRLTWRF